MAFKVCLSLLLHLCFCLMASGQEKFTINGTIRDKNNGELLSGATVSVAEKISTGTFANEYGYYSLTLPEGDYTLVFRFVGYLPQEISISLDKNYSLPISLSEDILQLEEAVVYAESGKNRMIRPQAGVEKLSTVEITNIPVLLGERDVLKTLQFIPGIKSSGEGNTGFYVRGGGSDQNLILLDEAPVYNASHLLGFFSTFNSDAIRDLTLYKGGMPAQYGGRLSSVLDIKMNEGNNQRPSFGGDIGLISAKLSAEGPLQKDKSSFFISARRTYADLFLKLSKDESLKNNQLFFYDINAKANYILSEKDKLFFSLYTGRDHLSLDDFLGIDWGNTTATLRWNHLMGSKFFMNTSAIFSQYNYNVLVDQGGSDLIIESAIRDWNLKQEIQFSNSPTSVFRFGLNSIFHTISPGSIRSSDPATLNAKSFQDRYSWENALFASHTLVAGDRLNLMYGFRFTAFSVLGKGDFYSLNDRKEVVDTTSYAKGEFVTTYFHIEPRFSASYRLSENNSLKISYARNAQNLHLLTNSTLSSPGDRWTPSSPLIKPEISDQVSMGYFRIFRNDQFEFSAEAYYKWLQNQIDYRDGSDPVRTEVVEAELLFGEGRSYGIELFLKKRTGRLNGWIGYTLSRTEKRIEGINAFCWYPAKQDRTHDLSLVLIYQLNHRWSLSGAWVYATGNAVTFPSGKYILDGQTVQYYTERNGYRVQPYHRLDMGATRQLQKNKAFSSELSFGLYNAYGRANPFMIKFRENPSDPSQTEAVKLALFKMVPSISYRFKF